MATEPTSTLAPVTEEAFLADRQQTWSKVYHTATGFVIFMAILLALMAAFLT
jgi:hypothetical protein